MKMKKKGLRFVAGVLAVTMLISSNSVFATTTAEYDEQIESIKSQQAENEAEAERLNEKLDSLRDQTSEAEAYQATLEEQITTYQTSIDLAVQNITQLNTNITSLEAEIKKADEEYADTFAELKVRLRSLYASGGNLTTLQILFDSTSLYDFSMRSEAMKTITKHDRELMEKIRRKAIWRRPKRRRKITFRSLTSLSQTETRRPKRKRKHAVRQKRTRMPRTTTPAAATRLPARVTRAMF